LVRVATRSVAVVVGLAEAPSDPPVLVEDPAWAVADSAAEEEEAAAEEEGAGGKRFVDVKKIKWKENLTI
jgi:hypothetical protein